MKHSFNYLSPESQLKCLGKLGEGSFGSVFLVEEVSTQNRYALKRSVKNSKNISREIMMLNFFRNQDFIMHMHTAFYTRDASKNLIQNILLEYKPHTLFQLIYYIKSRGERINEDLLKRIIQFILKGLLTMHNQLVAHRDLKPENILLSEDLEPCIGDLGSAKLLHPNKKHNPHVCTVLYRAPELIWGSDNYTVQVDMWSLGCIIGEMIYQKPIFYCTEAEHIFPAILHRLGGFNKKVKEYYCKEVLKVDPQIVFRIDQVFEQDTDFFTQMKNKSRVPPLLIDLISQMLKFNPNERITAQQALCHPYLNQDSICIYQNLQSSRESSRYGQQYQQIQKQNHYAQNQGQHARQYIQEQEYRRGLDNREQRKIQDNYSYQDKIVQQNMRGLYEQDNRPDWTQPYYDDLGQELTIFDIDQIKQQQQLQNERQRMMQNQWNNHQGQEQQLQQQERIKRQSPKLIGQGLQYNIWQKLSTFEQQNRQRNIQSNFQQDQRMNQSQCQQSQVGFQQNYSQVSWKSSFQQEQNSSFYGQGHGQSIQNRGHSNSIIEQEQQQLQQQVSQQRQMSGQQGQMRQIFGDQIQNSTLQTQGYNCQQGQQQFYFGQQTQSVFGQGQTSNLFVPNYVPDFHSLQRPVGVMNMWNNQSFNQQQAQEQTFQGQHQLQNAQTNFHLNLQNANLGQFYGQQQYGQGYQ